MRLPNYVRLAYLFCQVNTSRSILSGFDFSVKNIPAPDKKEKGGEDAWYTHQYLLSVADGVGGWNEQGVDPAKYSRKLEANVEKYFKSNEDAYIKNPKALMKIAADNNNEKGSSTFIIVTLEKSTNVLRTSLLGDSSYLILRAYADGQYKSLYRSEEQQHSFNFPFQCGTNGDPIESAVENSHDLQVNDIVIVGTDGVFDNLFDADIIDIVQKSKIGEVRTIADKIAQLAYEKSLDTKYNSPFSIGAKKSGYRFVGGKSDDITVAVGIVKEALSEEK